MLQSSPRRSLQQRLMPHCPSLPRQNLEPMDQFASWNKPRTLIQYKDGISHCGDKTVVRSSYLHIGISYTGKMSSLYWIGVLIARFMGPTWGPPGAGRTPYQGLPTVSNIYMCWNIRIWKINELAMKLNPLSSCHLTTSTFIFLCNMLYYGSRKNRLLVPRLKNADIQWC